ncbi:hypothetical protein [Streptomyces cylindrosporus]|uniref:Integral membrane protein n=1 Tax=Streptomyces cylindrosporus TaxID=2927583 RepID=A0ABS9Y9L5_9ACTN|nr:hypothetical protein [Streptomyces cylindrosporus]MCI3273918.1 hypothetical protein [Streptomyces cylindrosporus]
MLAFFGIPLISLLSCAVGVVPYRMWRARRRPTRPARWAVIGAFLAVVGYAGAVLYGLAFTDPVAVCGQRTLDDDFPLVHVTVDAFPPDVACYWTDSGTYGPTHPTALGSWTMWAGTGVLMVALSFLLLTRQSRTSRWVRAGVIGALTVAAAVWVTGIDPVLDLSRTNLNDQCLYRKTVPPDTKLTRIEILDIRRTVFPPSVVCAYSDGEADLLADRWAAVLVCLSVSGALTAVALTQVVRAGRRTGLAE